MIVSNTIVLHFRKHNTFKTEFHLKSICRFEPKYVSSRSSGLSRRRLHFKIWVDEIRHPFSRIWHGMSVEYGERIRSSSTEII
jgi:hypothetical protein